MRVARATKKGDFRGSTSKASKRALEDVSEKTNPPTPSGAYLAALLRRAHVSRKHPHKLMLVTVFPVCVFGKFRHFSLSEADEASVELGEATDGGTDRPRRDAHFSVSAGVRRQRASGRRAFFGKKSVF